MNLNSLLDIPRETPDLVTPTKELRRLLFESIRAITYPKLGMMTALDALAGDVKIIPDHLRGVYLGHSHLTFEQRDDLLAALKAHAGSHIVRNKALSLLGDLHELLPPPPAAILTWYMGAEWDPSHPLAYFDRQQYVDRITDEDPDLVDKIPNTPVVWEGETIRLRSPTPLCGTTHRNTDGSLELLVLPKIEQD